MRNFNVLPILMAIVLFLLGASHHVLAQSSVTVRSDKQSETMPPALQNMQGKPGFEQEHQKWVENQNQTPESLSQQAQKDIATLKAAKYNSPASMELSKPSTKAVAEPYLQYKGIVDPAKAKEAWYKDQAASKISK